MSAEVNVQYFLRHTQCIVGDVPATVWIDCKVENVSMLERSSDRAEGVNDLQGCDLSQQLQLKTVGCCTMRHMYSVCVCVWVGLSMA